MVEYKIKRIYMKTVQNIKTGILFLLLLAVLSQCKEDLSSPLEKNTTPPGVVSNVSVKNQAGKALIQYTLPSDQDLLYVKAVYTLASGKVMEVKSSYYNNSLEVEGFADTIEYNVQLFSVNRSEVASAPVNVKIKPMENPIWAVYRSMSAIPSFGGIQISAANELQRDLTIQVMVDSLGEWVPSIDNIYTSAKAIKQNVRGLKPNAETFAITIRDRWLNYTDTLVTTLTPLYESVLPKSGYRVYNLPTDAPQGYASTGIAKLWDNDTMVWPNVSLTSTTITTPQWITFDTGKLAKLSRIVIWDYPEYTNSGRMYYMNGSMRNFEVWASDNPPSDGSWNNWHKLGEFEQIKPSGILTTGTQTTEDYNYANAGISYDFDIQAPKGRYIRIKCNKNWSGTTYFSIAEVQLYGDAR